MEMNINTAINHKLQLSPTVFEQLVGYVEFKASFHCVSIQAQKDPNQKWYVLLGNLVSMQSY